MYNIPLILSYAEIHYHLKYLFPRYFKKEPEIIADLPYRHIIKNSPGLPVLLIVKDSDRFPVLLQEVKVHIKSRELKKIFTFQLQQKIETRFYSKIIHIPIDRFGSEQVLQIQVTIKIECDGKTKEILNDNYPNLNYNYFRTYLSENPLPIPDGYYAGEPHYHSNYTSDQVEFGADIRSTKEMAKSLGLNWLFVTDHSYDLDDEEDDYRRNDPQLTRWKKMLQECNAHDSEDLRIIPGEEVSIGNSNSQNVHLLAINHREFIKGSGDSAEKWFRNKPEHSLKEIVNLHDNKNLFIAAHPAEQVPFLQKLTLRRGSWQERDFSDAGIDILQIVNSNDTRAIDNAIYYWQKLLLKGKRFSIVAGNDAHGNFNVMRQIKIPFLKLMASHTQIFGKFFTILAGEKNDPVQNMKSGNIIISNGPFISFYLEANDRKYPIGSNIKTMTGRLHYTTKTNKEFGKIIELNLMIGDILSQREETIEDIENGSLLKLPEKGYLRMSLSTGKKGKAFTNPIWIG